MPIFTLTEEIYFPPVELTSEIGVLAIGGDLFTDRLLLAYRSGIFPWYSEGEPIMWWCPDPRFVLYPEELKISRTMRQILNRNIFEITCDTSFSEVIIGCSQPREKEKGTWITTPMLEAYCAFHESGYAHSVEAWKDGTLAGGLYGVSLGRCFFGESMFTRESNASKAAFLTLVKRLIDQGFLLIDCQVYTRHLESFGAKEVPRTEFLEILNQSLEYQTIQGKWGEMGIV